MLHLCIDARMAFSSGIGTCIQEIVPLLKQGPFQITLLVDQLDREWCRGIDQILFDAPIYSIKEQLLYPLKIPQCDLFWSPHYNVPLLPIRAKKRVFTIHDVCHLVFGSRLQKLYAKTVVQRAFHLSQRGITSSDFSKREIERYFGKRFIEVVPLGVNSNRFIPKSASDAIRKKYQLPERFALFVGNHKPHKNIQGLKRAFSRIQKSELELVLFGRDTSRGVLASEDLPILYSMAEVFVFPSFYEGFGLPPLEAMACGCPTVVSKAASLPQVCGEASLYFDPAKDQEIEAAVLSVIRNLELRNQLVSLGFQRIQQFNWEKTAERYMGIFEEVCRGK